MSWISVTTRVVCERRRCLEICILVRRQEATRVAQKSREVAPIVHKLIGQASAINEEEFVELDECESGREQS